MKILFLTSNLLSGGAERTTTYLSNYLAEQKNDVTILSISNKIFYEVGKNVTLDILNIDESPKNIIERVYLIAKRFHCIKKHLTQNKYDIVFCMIPSIAKYVLSPHRKLKFKLITSERINPESCNDKLQKLKERVYTQSDGIIFQTQRAMEFYPEHIQKKGIIIHNAIGNDYAYKAPLINARKNKITAIGRLAEQKDYPTLFTAFKKILQKYPEYTLEIFGDGPDKDKLKALSKQLNINESVYFMGAHEDAILQAVDSACYVMSSKFEGMPNALMEAMAVGLPCISTDCPNGPAELITSGENGVLVPVGDENALTDAILNFIENPAFAEMCGRNAKKILETHNINIKAKEYMDYIIKIFNEE